MHLTVATMGRAWFYRTRPFFAETEAVQRKSAVSQFDIAANDGSGINNLALQIYIFFFIFTN
jgi:hypothetical protein